ncbi:MAG: cyclase family protein [Myxococcales bacterium]|nr:cyclase family protein [Myxococcales bacterium]
MDVIAPIGGASWVLHLDDASDWTVPVQTGSEQTSAFGLRQTATEPVGIGGDMHLVVRDGGSVNCADVAFNPHGAGTHTEGIGHISIERRPVSQLQLPALLPATVLSVVPVRLGTTTETYGGDCHPDDLVVSVEPLARALSDLLVVGFDAAIVIRTREDDDSALQWSGRNPPYFTREAIAFLATLPSQHLLVDLPSIDRESDGGGVPNHLCWWGLPTGVRREAEAAQPDRSVTEMLCVPQHCGDGPWVLNVQIPALDLDAAPSKVLAWRPVRPS